ncbi:MAG: DNA cytosine methyltransferase [Spirochaetes bacterium]|nr:DNA cytosine methyltransferase [Spirochaetota bacterium]
MVRSASICLGNNKGTPRIYLQGKWLKRAGFKPGNNVSIRFGINKLEISIDPSGTRKVSGKKDGTIPVIDIQTKNLETSFRNVSSFQLIAGNNSITITPSHIAILMSTRVLVPTEASMFSGGGILSMAAKLCGFEPKLGIEINPNYAEIYESNHPSAVMFNMCVSQVPYEMLSAFKPIGLFTAGIPCEPFSQIRRNRTGCSHPDSFIPESHELGDMTFWALRGIESLNPHTAIIEEVPNFLKSGAGKILIHVLKRLYRYVESNVVSSVDYGSLCVRERAVIVAQDKPINWPQKYIADKTLGDILDKDNEEWFDRESKPWLFNHWDSQREKGNRFSSKIYDYSTKRVETIKKRYFSQQGDNPVIRHPVLENTYRWFSIDEVKRLHGIPDEYYLGDKKITAGEILGQGVVLSTFAYLIKNITGSLNNQSITSIIEGPELPTYPHR